MVPQKKAGLFSICFFLFAGLILIVTPAAAIQDLAEGEIRTTIKNSYLPLFPNLEKNQPSTRIIATMAKDMFYSPRVFYRSRGVFSGNSKLAAYDTSPSAAGQAKIQKAGYTVQTTAHVGPRNSNPLIVRHTVPSGNAQPPAAHEMQSMPANEMRRAYGAHHLGLLNPIISGGRQSNEPVTRVIDPDDAYGGMKALGEESMHDIAAGKPYIFDFTHEGIDVQFYVTACQTPRCWIGWEDEWDPILVVHSYRMNRGYYDVGLEQYGWEIDTLEAQWVREWKNARIMGLYRGSSMWDNERRPLEYRTYSHQRSWHPDTVLRTHVQPYWSGRGWQVSGCHYRENYFIFFKDEFPGERLVPPGKGTPVKVSSIPYWGPGRAP